MNSVTDSQVSRMATNELTYEFDVVNLRQKRITTFRRAVNAMERQIKKVLQEEESKKNRKIYLFSIGKTSTHKTAKAYVLDPFNVKTFTQKKSAIAVECIGKPSTGKTEW